MARLYMSSVNERRSTRTQCGHREIESHTRGWDLGVRVSARVVGLKRETVVEAELTGGSGNGMCLRHLGMYKIRDGKLIEVTDRKGVCRGTMWMPHPRVEWEVEEVEECPLCMALGSDAKKVSVETVR